MIEIEKLNKSFGTLKALDRVDASITAGSMNYIVGPNGSGKTTLIKCILGLVKPDSGGMFIKGEKLNGNYKYRSSIGYMPQQSDFPENLTVKEIFEMIKDIRQSGNSLDEELIQVFGLEKEFQKRLKNLSGGTKQKVNSAVAFLFDPQILILDEPTAGLDPVSSSYLKDKILKEHNRGKTIIFTSHILSELEELAENIIFILEGKIQFAGRKDELISSTEKHNLERAVASLMIEASK